MIIRLATPQRIVGLDLVGVAISKKFKLVIDYCTLKDCCIESAVISNSTIEGGYYENCSFIGCKFSGVKYKSDIELNRLIPSSSNVGF